MKEERKALIQAYKLQPTYYGVIQLTNTINHKIYIDAVPTSKVAGSFTKPTSTTTSIISRHFKSIGIGMANPHFLLLFCGKRKQMTSSTCVPNSST